MPKHITSQGTTVDYHSIVIRFTPKQWSGLISMSRQTGKKINETVRLLVNRQLEALGLIESQN